MNFSDPGFQVPIISTIVGWIADIMRIGLQFCYNLTLDFGFPSYGIAIVVLTIIIKTLLLPLAIKQIRSMKAMQEIQPLLQKVQKKYKNDPQRLREEMSKLYSEHGANPMSGCLPLLIQMPFLVAIYYAIQGFPYDPAHASFLWIENLSAVDSTYALPLLSAISTFVVSKQTMPKDAPGNQKTMLIVMPIMIGWMATQFPSGLVIYWIVINLYQIVQQAIMFRHEGIVPTGPSTAAAAAKKAEKAEKPKKLTPAQEETARTIEERRKEKKKAKAQKLKAKREESGNEEDNGKSGQKKQKVIHRTIIKKVVKKKPAEPAAPAKEQEGKAEVPAPAEVSTPQEPVSTQEQNKDTGKADDQK